MAKVLVLLRYWVAVWVAPGWHYNQVTRSGIAQPGGQMIEAGHNPGAAG
jgi:hypothetical protein